MKRFAFSLLKLAGITFLRFRPIPRLWCVWLAAINLGCILFIQHIEAQVVLLVSVAAVLVQAGLYQKIGFVRLLGIAHILWIPMFAWMATRVDTISSDPALQMWLAVLALTNAASLIVDGFDVTRYLRGERGEHYSWN